MSRFYLIAPAADATERMADPTCYTTDPRLNIAATEAVLSYTDEQTGGLSQSEALDLMAGPAWTGSDSSIP